METSLNTFGVSEVPLMVLYGTAPCRFAAEMIAEPPEAEIRVPQSR